MNENSFPTSIDVLVIGAGAAGLFCGAQAGQRGLSVIVIDHMLKPAEKVRISGGGRCNFTNIHTSPKAFLSANPHFAKSALARYTPQDFLDLLTRHSITWNDKGRGQLFCDGKSGQIIDMLTDELSIGNGSLHLGVSVLDITPHISGFRVETSHGDVEARRLVIASGGLSIPKIGATSFAYDVAKRYGHKIEATRPALVPLTFSAPYKDEFAMLAGVTLPVRAEADGTSFDESMLFTHRGLSGPAILQISSYWREGQPITLNVIDTVGDADSLITLKNDLPAKQLHTAIDRIFPKRFADYATRTGLIPSGRKLAEMSNTTLKEIATGLSRWTLKPTGTEGYRTAEVTAGGISTEDISSKTMESRKLPGLYFIGEAVDVTGWLGGYNFQWAWASAHACAEAMAEF